jgi:hypothetical protein
MVLASFSVACPHKMRSSGKSSEWIVGQSGPRVTPVKLELYNSCCQVMESSLIATTNR